MAESRAARHCEPGQDRKVAALSGTSRVTWGRSAGANEPRQAGMSLIDRGCTTNLFEKHIETRLTRSGAFASHRSGTRCSGTAANSGELFKSLLTCG
ncbi:hypothetical protein BH23CHL5_BH23CHL5_12710 [soil metagenome]